MANPSSTADIIAQTHESLAREAAARRGSGIQRPSSPHATPLHSRLSPDVLFQRTPTAARTYSMDHATTTTATVVEPPSPSVQPANFQPLPPQKLKSRG